MRVNRIFILLGNLGSGGAERVAANMANYFVSNGKEVVIAVYEDSNNFYELDERVKLIPLHLMFDSKSFVTKVTNTIKRLGIIRKVVLNYKPDIVVAFLTSPSVLGVLALLGSKIPFVASERSNPYVYPKEMSLRLMRDYTSYLTDGYIFQTKRAMDYFPMSVRRKSTVIPNPVSVSNIPDIWRGSREKIIASMGRLSDQKDHETLIRAFSIVFKEHMDYRLVIYGEGPDKKRLQELCEKEGVYEAVDFPGAKRDAIKLIAKAQVFVLSSKAEGFPNALVEAMAAGIPSISTDCPMGPSEVIENGKNGILVPMGDEHAMAASINKIIEDNAFSVNISEEGYKIREKFSSELVFGQIEKYFEEIILKKNKKIKLGGL